MKEIVINEKTKKIINTCICVMIVMSIAIGAFVCGWYAHKEVVKEYTVEATVTEVIPDTNEVFFETPSGHAFSIVTDEVFAAYEKYTITFNTNSTPTVEDDEIYHISRNIEMSMS